MTLREAKQAIRSFIREHWSDQRLAEIYCFNRDGKMCYFDHCGCLLGVTLSVQLHTQEDATVCSCGHYSSAELLVGAFDAEDGYGRLMEISNREEDGESHSLADRRLSAILRGELRRRERERAAAQLSRGIREAVTA